MPSAPLPKFVIHCSNLRHELRKQRGTSKSMILVCAQRTLSRQEPTMVARMRHIALSVPDPEKAAKFFEEAYGMKRAGPAGLGLYMTDGTINIALLKFPGDVPGFPPGQPYYGLIHFGMWVD